MAVLQREPMQDHEPESRAPIRILLADVTGMLRDILAGVIESEASMRLVGVVERRAEVADAVATREPHIVLVGLENGVLPAQWVEVFRRFPHVKVLAIEQHGKQASLFELRPVRTLLGEASPTALVAWIRDAVRPMAWTARTRESEPAAAMETTARFQWNAQGGTR
jgi:DNA-binding NarL/FixJ family response regulator